MAASHLAIHSTATACTFEYPVVVVGGGGGGGEEDAA